MTFYQNLNHSSQETIFFFLVYTFFIIKIEY